MDITTHYAVLPPTDPDAALAFYRDTLTFEGRDDVGGQGRARRRRRGPRDGRPA